MTGQNNARSCDELSSELVDDCGGSFSAGTACGKCEACERAAEGFNALQYRKCGNSSTTDADHFKLREA